MQFLKALSVILMLFLAGCTSEANKPTETPPVQPGSVHEIEITSAGFSPNQLSITTGDKVVFVNKDANEHWPASVAHPTHRVYPGSGIDKCRTDEEKNIFDACRGLKNGESFEFTFSEKGRWCYHDHMKADLFGCIVVE